MKEKKKSKWIKKNGIIVILVPECVTSHNVPQCIKIPK